MYPNDKTSREKFIRKYASLNAVYFIMNNKNSKVHHLLLNNKDIALHNIALSVKKKKYSLRKL